MHCATQEFNERYWRTIVRGEFYRPSDDGTLHLKPRLTNDLDLSTEVSFYRRLTPPKTEVNERRPVDRGEFYRPDDDG